MESTQGHRSRLLKLPNELFSEILFNLDPPSLLNLAQTNKEVHDRVTGDEVTITKTVKRIIGPDVFKYAIRAYTAPRNRSGRLAEVEAWCKANLNHKPLDDKLRVDLRLANALWAQHRTVSALTDMLIAKAKENWSELNDTFNAAPLTENEVKRFHRTLYQFEAFHKLKCRLPITLHNGVWNDDSDDESRNDVIDLMHDYHGELDIYQHACVAQILSDYVAKGKPYLPTSSKRLHCFLSRVLVDPANWLSEVFNDVAVEDISWGNGPHRLAGTTDLRVQYLVTQGLQPTLKLLNANSYEDRHRAISRLNPEWNNGSVDTISDVLDEIWFFSHIDRSGQPANYQEEPLSAADGDDGPQRTMERWQAQAIYGTTHYGLFSFFCQWGATMWDQRRIDIIGDVTSARVLDVARVTLDNQRTMRHDRQTALAGLFARSRAWYETGRRGRCPWEWPGPRKESVYGVGIIFRTDAGHYMI